MMQRSVAQAAVLAVLLGGACSSGEDDYNQGVRLESGAEIEIVARDA